MAYPTTLNFLNPTEFRLVVPKFPEFENFAQVVILPELSLNRTTQPTPFSILPRAGIGINWGELQVTFTVDEGLYNYLEIYDWMIGMGIPESFDQFRPEDQATDISLIIMNSNRNPSVEIKFLNAYPTTLRDIRFNVTAETIQYPIADVTFLYDRWVYKRLQ